MLKWQIGFLVIALTFSGLGVWAHFRSASSATTLGNTVPHKLTL